MATTRQITLTAMLLATAMPCTAWAQDGDAPQLSGGVASGEIVVTARRREEALSKVPLSITAFNSETLTAKSIQNENDLSTSIPGLLIKQGGSQNALNYVIRGQTVDQYSNSPPGVLPYINEAQIQTWSATSFYDLAGIQVLKGPQGTLFGRNTTGGAVLYETRKPSHEFEGYVRARYGRWDSHQIQGAINLPFGETFALRVAASTTGGGGYVRRLDTGKRTGNLEQDSVRASLLIDPPGSGFKNTLVVQYAKDRGTNAANGLYNSSSFACGNGTYTDSSDCFYANYWQSVPNAAALEALKLGVIGAAARQEALGPYKALGTNTSLKHFAKSTWAINTTEYELNPDLLIKNIFSYNRSWSDERNDYDSSPFPLISVFGNLRPDLTGVDDEGSYYNRSTQYSNELQIQGKAFDNRFDYVVGLYYIHQVNNFDSEVAFFDFYPFYVYGSPTISYFPVHYAMDTTNESYAGFAQGTFALTDQLSLTGGFRYTWDKTSAKQHPTSQYYGCDPAVCGATGVGPAFPQSVKESKPSWNISFDFQATPSLMFYLTHRGSWRSGGFNYTISPKGQATAAAGGNLFTPETTYDVEGGMKYSGRDLGVPITFNLAVYNQWIKNIQRGANVPSPLDGTSILATIAVPRAKVTGVEVDFSVRPANWLDFGATIAYSDARYTNNSVTFSGTTLVFGPYADSPKWSSSAYAEVSQDLGPDTGLIKLRGDYYYQSSNYFSNLDILNPGTKLPSYDLIGARLSWSDIMGSTLALSLYGRNLANEKYYVGGNATGYSAGFNVAFPGYPRMYGVEASYEF